MRKRKLLKQLTALMLGAALMVPAPAAAAASMPSEWEREGRAAISEGVRAVDADGFEIEDGVLVTYSGTAKHVVIPSGVTEIGEEAFYYCGSLRSVVIPEGVTVIGDWAFGDDEELLGVSIPESVTEIGSNAFSGCDKLTIFGKAGSYAQTYAEKRDIPFSEEGMPGEFKEISECEITLSQTSYDYDGQPKTPAVTVKDGGTVLTEGTHYTVSYRDNVEGGTAYATVTGKGGYLGSRDMEFTIVAQDFTIEDGVLVSYKGNAEQVVIPDGVKEIRALAFYSNSSIKRVTVPASVEKVSSQAFWRCCNLAEISVAEANNTYASMDGCLYNKEKSVLLICPDDKAELEIPAGVKEIGIGGTVHEGSKLERIVVPQGAVKIGNNAFDRCTGLGGISIPASVTEIGKYAFSAWYGLTIYGKAGSYAETYARENNIPFSTEEMPQMGASRKISDCQVMLIQDSCIYDGGEQNPRVVVKNGTHILNKTANWSYSSTYKPECTVTYKNNIEIGTGEIIITGTEGYTGTVTRTFTIRKGEPIRLSFGKNAKNLRRVNVWDVVYDSNGNVYHRYKRYTPAEGSDLAVEGSHYRFEAQSGTGCKLLDGEKNVQEGVVKDQDVVVIFKYQTFSGFVGGHGARILEGSICYDLYARTEDGKAIDGIRIYKEGYITSDEYGEEPVFFTDECRYNADGSYKVMTGGLEEGHYFSWFWNSTVNGYTKLMIQQTKEDGTIVQYIPRDFQTGYREIIDDNGQDGTDENGNKLRKIFSSDQYDEQESVRDSKVSVLDASGNKIGDVVIGFPKDKSVLRASPEVDLSYRVENLAKGWKLAVKLSRTDDFFEHPTTGAKIAVSPHALVSITATKLTGMTGKQQQSISVTKTYNKTYGDKAFSLKAKLKKGNGKLTYTSSAKNVAAVDKNSGKVSIKGTGAAVITVRAGATSTYKEATAKILVKVKPAKQKTPALKVQKGKKLKVSWKKDKNATGYEIQYSTDKKFKNKKVTKSVQMKKNKTVTATIKKLKAKKQYYVRIRAYKSAKINGKNEKLYGAWSSAKRSSKIK